MYGWRFLDPERRNEILGEIKDFIKSRPKIGLCVWGMIRDGNDRRHSLKNTECHKYVTHRMLSHHFCDGEINMYHDNPNFFRIIAVVTLA